MHEKILPLNTNPIIQTQSNIADLCCILGTIKQFDHWLCSNFFHNQYGYHHEYKHILYLPAPIYEECELFEFDYKILKDEFSCNEIIEFIVSFINDDKYLIIEINGKFLPKFAAFNKYNYMHRQLFYGYSIKNSCLYFMCYDENGLYIPSEINFLEFFNALQNSSPYEPILTLKIKNVDYKLKIDRIACEFKNYCNTTKLQTNNREYFYGITAVEKFKDAFYDILNDNIDKNYLIDISYLKDHKKVLKLKLLILQKYGIDFSEEIFSLSEKIFNYASISLSLFIKYLQTKNKKYIGSIIKNIDNIVLNERELYPLIFESINNYLVQIGMTKIVGFNDRELEYYIKI